MRAVQQVSGAAIPLGRDNVDTDIIIAARYLKAITRLGLGEGAFAVLRAVPGNVFDRPRARQAPILIAGANFGCGSSREHAVWALMDRGVRAVIAVSFADIFSSNAFKNGLLLVALAPEHVARLLVQAGDLEIAIDLERQVVVAGADIFAFEIDPFRKHCLLNGLDEIELTLQMDGAIAAHERQSAARRPWL